MLLLLLIFFFLFTPKFEFIESNLSNFLSQFALQLIRGG
jgi:hypothetical protein